MMLVCLLSCDDDRRRRPVTGSTGKGKSGQSIPASDAPASLPGTTEAPPAQASTKVAALRQAQLNGHGDADAADSEGAAFLPVSAGARQSSPSRSPGKAVGEVEMLSPTRRSRSSSRRHKSPSESGDADAPRSRSRSRRHRDHDRDGNRDSHSGRHTSRSHRSPRAITEGI